MVTAQLTSTGVSFHNVLIATDLSHCSDAALGYGFQLARRYQAHAHLIHVIPLDEFLMAGPEAVVAARDTARRDLQDLEQHLQKEFSSKANLDYRVHLLEGSVADSILACANDQRIDLIVVGTHGRGSLGKMLLGSVAEQVFLRSTVPVLTIGPHLHQRSSAEPRNILLATNLDRGSRRAAQYAASLAQEHNAPLTVIHVIGQVTGEELGDKERVRRVIEEELTTLIGDTGCGLDARCRAEFGQPVPTILHVAQECEAGYIVLGVREHRGFGERFLWTTAYGVAREAQCPVMTVRYPA